MATTSIKQLQEKKAQLAAEANSVADQITVAAAETYRAAKAVMETAGAKKFVADLKAMSADFPEDPDFQSPVGKMQNMFNAISNFANELDAQIARADALASPAEATE